MNSSHRPENSTSHVSSTGVWFPTIRANTGADKFTERLTAALNKRGIRSEITWLPQRAEYLPWSVAAPAVPPWARIVHINPWLHTRFIPRHLPCLATLHTCVHDKALRPYKKILQVLYHRFWMYQIERDTLRRADKITAVSQYTAHISEKTFGHKNIAPIYNWIDTSVFKPGGQGKPHRPFRLFFAGKLNKLKGADLLPKIMSRLGSGFELHFTGTTEDLRQFGSLPNNLVPLGWLTTTEQIISCYQRCDALLFPTRLEGLPLVALEAMACGLPVVASNAASLPEVIIHGETGLLCEQDDVDDFINAIKSLKHSKGRITSMSDKARQSVVTTFSEDSALEHYMRIYQSLTQCPT